MNFIFTSIYLDFKDFFHQFTKILLILILLIIFIFSSVLLYPKLLESNNKKIDVMIVNEDENPLTPALIQFITSMEDFSDNFNFSSEYDYTAQDKSIENEVDVIIKIPKEFLSNVIRGKNDPFEVHINSLSPIEYAGFLELMNGAVKIISSSQVGIYSTLDYLRLEQSVSKDVYEKGLNGVNFYFARFMLGRKSLLKERIISPAGAYTIQEYYFLSFTMMIMLIYSIINISSVHNICKKPMVLLIRSCKIPYHKFVLAKILYIFIFNMFSFIILFFLLVIFFKDILNLNISLNLINVFYLAAFNMLITLFTVMIGFLLRENNSCYIFIISAALVMTFLSGGFIPPALLPPIFDKLKLFTLNYYGIGLLSGFLSISINLKIIYISILCNFIMFVAVFNFAGKLYKNYGGM